MGALEGAKNGSIRGGQKMTEIMKIGSWTLLRALWRTDDYRRLRREITLFEAYSTLKGERGREALSSNGDQQERVAMQDTDMLTIQVAGLVFKIFFYFFTHYIFCTVLMKCFHSFTDCQYWSGGSNLCI